MAGRGAPGDGGTSVAVADTAAAPGSPLAPATPGPADGELLPSALRIAVMRLARRIRSETSDESLTLTQLSALSTIAHHGPLSPTALAERERVQPPSMTRVIALLEERGLVQRLANPRDGRQAVIEISELGRETIEEDLRRRTVWLGQALAGLEPEQRAALEAATPVIELLALR